MPDSALVCNRASELGNLGRCSRDDRISIGLRFQVTIGVVPEKSIALSVDNIFRVGRVELGGAVSSQAD